MHKSGEPSPPTQPLFRHPCRMVRTVPSNSSSFQTNPSNWSQHHRYKNTLSKTILTSIFSKLKSGPRPPPSFHPPRWGTRCAHHHRRPPPHQLDWQLQSDRQKSFVVVSMVATFSEHLVGFAGAIVLLLASDLRFLICCFRFFGPLVLYCFMMVILSSNLMEGLLFFSHGDSYFLWSYILTTNGDHLKDNFYHDPLMVWEDSANKQTSPWTQRTHGTSPGRCPWSRNPKLLDHGSEIDQDIGSGKLPKQRIAKQERPSKSEKSLRKHISLNTWRQ